MPHNDGIGNLFVEGSKALGVAYGMSMLLAYRDLLTAALMGFSSGYVTSNTKSRFDTFGGMMTGNTVKLGMSLERGDWEWVGVYVAVLSSFALGTMYMLILTTRATGRWKLVALLPPALLLILVDGLALAIRDSGGSTAYESLASSLAAFALGAQNCLSQKSTIVKANTTFMTGNIQKMTEAVFMHSTKGLKPAETRAALLLLYTWSMYIVGGVCGVASAECSASFCREWSLAPASVLYLLGMASMQIEPRQLPAVVPPLPPAAAAAKADVPAAQVVPTAPVAEPLEVAVDGSWDKESESTISGKHPESRTSCDYAMVHRRSLGEEPQL